MAQAHFFRLFEVMDLQNSLIFTPPSLNTILANTISQVSRTGQRHVRDIWTFIEYQEFFLVLQPQTFLLKIFLILRCITDKSARSPDYILVLKKLIFLPSRTGQLRTTFKRCHFSIQKKIPCLSDIDICYLCGNYDQW